MNHSNGTEFKPLEVGLPDFPQRQEIGDALDIDIMKKRKLVFDQLQLITKQKFTPFNPPVPGPKKAKIITLPAGYTLKINPFSLFSDIVTKTGIHKYHSNQFEAGGCKWKLHLYPNGDAERNGHGHISLYLALDHGQINAGLNHGQINAMLKFFVYDHIRDKWVIIQDGEAKCFHPLPGMRRTTEHGFPQLISHSTFYDSRNGYLVDDHCVFGVKVNVIQSRYKEEVFSITKVPPQHDTVTWKVERFSTLLGNCLCVFGVGGYTWKLSLFPQGDSEEDGTSLSLYLVLVHSNALANQGIKCYNYVGKDQGVYAECYLLIKDQVHGIHHERKVNHWYRQCLVNRSQDCRSSILLSDLLDASKGYVVNDTVVIEAKFSLISRRGFS